MDLAVEPDIYEPNINEKKDYIDNIPYLSKFKNGLRCPCGTRKEHVFDSRNCFAVHIKTKTHQKWLSDMNTNRSNYYTENVQLKETIVNQKLIIARLEKEVNLKLKTIDYLTQQLVSKETCNVVTNLLEFD
jgi:hypothetical protein